MAGVGVEVRTGFFQCGDLVHTYELNAEVSVGFCTDDDDVRSSYTAMLPVAG